MSEPRRWHEYGECEWVEAEAYDAAKNRIKYLEAQLAEANEVIFEHDKTGLYGFIKRARQYLEKWKVGK